MVGLLFRQFYSCTDSYTLSKLYLTIVQPHLEYAGEVWDPHLDKDIKLIEKVQKFASRVCLKRLLTNRVRALESTSEYQARGRRPRLTFANQVSLKSRGIR